MKCTKPSVLSSLGYPIDAMEKLMWQVAVFLYIIIILLIIRVIKEKFKIYK
jgi:hypothetical protein